MFSNLSMINQVKRTSSIGFLNTMVSLWGTSSPRVLTNYILSCLSDVIDKHCTKQTKYINTYEVLKLSFT